MDEISIHVFLTFTQSVYCAPKSIKAPRSSQWSKWDATDCSTLVNLRRCDTSRPLEECLSRTRKFVILKKGAVMCHRPARTTENVIFDFAALFQFKVKRQWMRRGRRIVAYPRLFSWWCIPTELVMSPGQSLQLNSTQLLRLNASYPVGDVPRALQTMNAKNTKKITDSWECGREHNLRFWWRWHQPL